MAGGGIVHQFRHHKGMDAVLALFINGSILFIPCADPPACGAQHNARGRGQFARKHQTRLINRLFGRQQRKLGKAVVEGQLLPVEYGFWFKIMDLATDFDRQTIHIAKFQFTDATVPSLHCSQRLGHILPKGIDRAGPRDNNPVQDCSATRVSTPAIMRATDEISKSPFVGSLALNGTWMSKASSIANMHSTSPRLSMPNCSSVLSKVTSDGSNTACCAKISMTCCFTDIFLIPCDAPMGISLS